MPRNAKRGKLADLMYPAMTKRHMSVQGLASALEVNRQTCYAWLHEYQRPSLEMLRRIGQVLNIPMVELVAATHQDVMGVRLESLIEVYLGLPEEKRRLLEAVARAFEAENQQNVD